MVTKNSSYAMEECARFEFCQINKCPLSEDYQKLENDSSDPAIKNKQKCIAKSIRKRIGLKWKLKNKGMTPREIKSQQNWDALPESVKQERIAKLKKNSPVSQLLGKGCKITPPRIKQTHIPHTNSEKTLTGTPIGVVCGEMEGSE